MHQPHELPAVYDLIVAGASRAACAAALAAAQDGQRVLIATPHAFLTTDQTATLRTWADDASPVAGAPGPCKRDWFHRLRAAGVTLLFQSRPTGLVQDAGGAVAGLVTTGKSGLQAIFGRRVMDATGNGLLLRIAAIPTTRHSEPLRWCFELAGLPALDPDDAPLRVPVPPELGLCDNAVRLRPLAGTACCIAELVFEAPAAEAPERARHLMEQVLRHLVAQDPQWSDVLLLRTADQPLVPPPVAAGILPAGLCTVADSGSGTGAATGPLQIRFAPDLALPLEQLNPRRPAPSSWLPIDHLALDPPPPDRIPVAARADVLVVGAGTSGAPAALAAAEQNAHTVVIESSHDPGGTGCEGGINEYYHGFRQGYTARCEDCVGAMTGAISPGSPRDCSHWNIAARQLTLRNLLAAHGAEQFYGTTFLSTIGSPRVRGVLAAGPDGLLRIDATVTIDATGDGDVAVSAGAEAEMGDPRDGMVQTHNQCTWGRAGNRKGNNVDLGCVDNRSPADINRGIYRRHVTTGDGDGAPDGDFTGLPVYRESRRIRGVDSLTLREVMLGLDQDDAIAVALTDFDQHGLQSSLYARLGLLPYHKREFLTVIPFGICIPRHLQGLLIAGKAVSATREAFAFVRMQPDLQNLGYAVGMAAARMAAQGCDARQLDLRPLQTELAAMGLLPAQRPEQRLWNPAELSSRLGSEPDLFAVLLQPPELLHATATACLESPDQQQRLHAAMALAWLGDSSGLPLLLTTLEDLADQPQASDWDKSGRPNGGYVDTPSVYWRVNQLIILLGLSGDARALPLLCRLTAATDAGGRENAHVRLHWRRVPNCDRIVCLCTALEHLADTSAVPALEALLAAPGVGGHAGPPAELADESFPSAHLEVVIARALARCGGRAGITALTAFLNDPRALLADHALAELRELSAQSFGRERAAWLAWLATADLSPLPCRRYSRL